MDNKTISTYVGKGIGKRLGAAIIDGLIFILLTIIVGTVLDYSHITTVFNLDYSHINIITFIISAFYFVYFEAVHGQTLGKKIFKLKVINISKPASQGLGWIKATIRSALKLFVLCYFASLASFRAGEVSGMYAVLSAIEIFLLNKTKQGWYDVLSNTVVVQKVVPLEGVNTDIHKSKIGSKIFAIVRFIAVFVGAIQMAMTLIK